MLCSMILSLMFSAFSVPFPISRFSYCILCCLEPTPTPSLLLSIIVIPFCQADVFSWRQYVSHHSLCFLLSTVLLSVSTTHAREKGVACCVCVCVCVRRGMAAADGISRWRFHYQVQGPSCVQRNATWSIQHGNI